MPIYLKQSTASQEVPLGHFVDSTDGVTAETALSIANTDIKVWKTGATTLANKNSGGATHISGGVYYCVLDATDTDTLGPLVIFVAVSGALAVRVECVVLAANIYDSLIGGGDVLDVSVTQISGSAVSTTTAQLGVNVVQISADATAADNAEAFFDGTGYAGTNNVIPTVTTVTNLTNAPTSGDLTATMKASVNAEVVDALNTDTYAEPGQGAPAATTTLAAKINYLYKAWRNKVTQTSTTYSLFADDASTVDQKATVSDDGTTFTRGEIATGP
jgi:hypothetical protein